MKGRIHPPQPFGRGTREEDAVEKALARFQDRLHALEREGQVFQTFSGWKDESHRARVRDLLRELNALERALIAAKPPRQQLAFQQHNMLLRYQAFKRTYRQFWEQLTG
jgi:hypothetical protein